MLKRTSPPQKLALPTASFPAALALTALALTACHPAETAEKEPAYLVERWLAEDVMANASTPSIFVDEERLRWDFRTADDLAGWRNFNTDLAYEVTTDGLYLRSSSADPYLWRDVDFAAADVDLLRVTFGASAPQVAPEVYWAGPDGHFSRDRKLSSSSSERGEGTARVFTFDVHKHPQWHGRVTKLRIDPTSNPEWRVRIRSLSAYSRRVDEERLLAALARPVKATLDSEARNALLAPPRHPIARQVDVPARAFLRVGYGLPSGKGSPVTFRITARQGDDETELFQRQLDPRSTTEQGWHDAEVDLAAYAGKTVTLELETVAEDFDVLAGFPLWSHPEVVRRSPVKAPVPVNVILVSIDTLRADHTSLYGYSRPTTPRLDAWAGRRGVVFEKTVAAAPWTLPSHVSIFSGQDALRHGVNYNYAAPPDLVFLAEILRDAGYATAAVTGGAYVAPAYGFDQGFDRFRFYANPKPKHENVPGKDLEGGLEAALAWIRDTREPFFLFLHTYEVHAPFVSREPWISRFAADLDAEVPPGLEILPLPVPPEAENGWRFNAIFQERTPETTAVPISEDRQDVVRAVYDSGIAYTDDRLGKLLDEVSAMGLDGRTLVVLTSDHGEAFGEKDLIGHASLYDFNLLVPLVIALPDGRGAGSRVATQVRSIDIAPTILDALGIALPTAFEGRSLLPLLDDPEAPFPTEAESYAASTNFGLSLRVANRWKHIYQNSVWPALQHQHEAFDLARDPDELVNLAGSAPIEDVRQEMMRRYDVKASRAEVRLANHESGSARLTLRGALVGPATVKAFGLPCGDCVRLEKGHLILEVPAGRTVEIHLEGLAAGQLAVDLLQEDGAARPIRWSRTLALDDLSAPLRILLKDRAFVSTDEPLADGQTGIELSWQGRRSSAEAQPSLGDEALKERLRDLGYIQ